MQPRSIRKHVARQPLRSLRALALIPACLALGACSTDELSLGAGDGPLEAGEPACAHGEGGVVAGDVTARNQEEIDALAGCEQVLGDLTIVASSTFDVRALASLRFVRGGLTIGAAAGSLSSDDNGDGIDDISGQVSSLEGLEALEEVRSLRIAHLQSADLLPLSHLKSVRVGQHFRPGHLLGGHILISGSPNLVSLAGLEGLQEWSAIALEDNAALASLDGLGIPDEQIVSVSIYSAPALRDLSALADVLTADEVSLVRTGLENLDGLNLREINSLTASDNPNLVEMDALVYVQSIREWYVARNPKLDHLPELPSLSGFRTLHVSENDELRSIPFYANPSSPAGFDIGGSRGNPDEAATRPDDFALVEIVHNPKLTQFSLPRRFEQGAYLDIHENASLIGLDLTTLRRVDGLSIRDNPMLSSLDIEDLETVDDLAVEDNPALSVADFAEVKSFNRTLDGNADALAGP